MQELIQKIAEKAGITPEQAQIAFQTAQEYFAQQKTNASTATGENKDGFFDNIKEKAEEIKERANEFKEKATEKFDELQLKGKEKMEEIKEIVTEKIDELAEAAKEKINKLL